MQVLLKEKALNTEQLLKQHNELKEKLKLEKKAKQNAQTSVSKYKKANEGMQKRVGRLEEQVAQLQTNMAVLLHQQREQSGGGASGSVSLLDIVTRGEMSAVQKQVAGLEKQINLWNKAMKGTQQQGGGGGSSKKRAAAADGGAGAADRLAEEDPVRARAVAARKANKAAREPQQQQQQQQRQLQPPKKKVRLSEDPGQQHLVGGGSAGGSEAAPPGFADVAIAALRAVMGADAEQPPSTAAVQDAKHIFLGPLGSITTSGGGNNSSQKRNIIATFACAVLECAAAAPAHRFAAGTLSPRLWFDGSHAGGGGGADAAGQSSQKASGSSKKSKKSASGSASLSIPSFLGVWCSSEVLQRHSLSWLLHCAVEISAASSSPAPEAEEQEEEEEAVGVQNLCQILAQDLALLVLKDLATPLSSSRPLLHSPTELCAAAAAAGALWRSQGDFRSFQVFILDILLCRLGNNEVDVLAPLAAAIESWPEALFQNKGTLGSAVHSLLQYACTAGKSCRALEIRLAATWLRKIGVEEWGWSEEVSEEDAEEEVGEARKQLVKYAPSTMKPPAPSPILVEYI